mmetsp:Transcript_25558/g.38595  ORF Transcript_25558/g.38595 Transcript_25558/m.38595 type:complete len:501 (+) Transcript_25558:107-1609(+)
MTTIPFDPAITLGGLVVPQRFEQLMALAEAAKPQKLVEAKLNHLIGSAYKFDQIYAQMVNFNCEFEDLQVLHEAKRKVKKEMAQAAVQMGIETIKSEKKIFELKVEYSQMTIQLSAESPVDFFRSKIESFPRSFNMFEFDVQYFRREGRTQTSSAHASSVASKVSILAQGAGTHFALDAAMNANSNSMKTMEKYDIDGTIVIMSNCTHKEGDIVEPCILDPNKAVKTWNQLFPDDELETDPVSMIQAATAEDEEEGGGDKKPKFMSTISGCDKGSSFVGFVHLHKSTLTKSSQETSAMATSLKTSFEAELFIGSVGGSFGLDTSSASSAKSLFSTANIENNCSFVVNGVIPKIKTSTVESTVKKLQPDANEIMGQLGAIQEASKTEHHDDSSQAQGSVGEAKKGQSFMSLNNQHLKDTVSELAEYDKRANKVIDINSMWNTFRDYLENCKEGKGGVPTNFYTKEITKADVAKCYIKTFYPYGASGAQALRGTFGVKPKDS